MAFIQPSEKWQAVHQPVVYRKTFTSYAFQSVIDVGGKARLLMTSGAGNFSVDQRCYIATGVYAGNWSVSGVYANGLLLTADFISADADNITPLSNIDATVWAGYQVGHDGHDIYPYRKIAEFVGVAGINGEVTMDISGYLKSLFKNLGPPRLGVDLTMSFPFDVEVGAEPRLTRYALNATIPSADLQPYTIVANPVALQIGIPPHFTDGRVMYSYINDTVALSQHVVNVMGASGSALIGGIGWDAVGSTFTIG